MIELKPIYKNFYTGDMDAYHEGACCGGCIGERELGYSGGGNYCCCYEGLTPLEQWNNPVKYPPINGQVPEVFMKWKIPTQERWYKRFKDQLEPELSVRLGNWLKLEKLRFYKKDVKGELNDRTDTTSAT